MYVERTVTIAAATKRRAATIALSARSRRSRSRARRLAGAQLRRTGRDQGRLDGSKAESRLHHERRGAGIGASDRGQRRRQSNVTAKKLEEATRVEEPAAPAPKRTPVLVLTDKDFEKTPPPAAVDGAAAPSGEAAPASAAETGAPEATAPAAAPGAPASPGSAAAQPASAPAAAPAVAAKPITQPIAVPSSDALETRVAHQMPGPPMLRITSWSARPTGEDQLSIFGTVQNVGSRVTAAVDVAVTLFDSEGTRIEVSRAVRLVDRLDARIPGRLRSEVRRQPELRRGPVRGQDRRDRARAGPRTRGSSTSRWVTSRTQPLDPRPPGRGRVLRRPWSRCEARARLAMVCYVTVRCSAATEPSNDRLARRARHFPPASISSPSSRGQDSSLSSW